MDDLPYLLGQICGMLLAAVPIILLLILFASPFLLIAWILGGKKRKARRLQRQQEEGRFVYLIQADNGLTKIGVTNDIETRLGVLSRMSPVNLSVLGVCKRLDAFQFENSLHKHFAHKRRSGEWFALTQADIDYLFTKYGFQRYRP